MLEQLAAVVITCKSQVRQELLHDKVLPALRKQVDHVVLVGEHENFWERDKGAKQRYGFQQCSNATWVAFLDDDILVVDGWAESLMDYASQVGPAQIGFRLVNSSGNRHGHGEDWRHTPTVWPFWGNSWSGKHGPDPSRSRPLEYFQNTAGSYVANGIVHRDVFEKVPPFGIFGQAPDVMWSFAIKQAGFPVLFCQRAVACHLGNKTDYRNDMHPLVSTQC